MQFSNIPHLIIFVLIFCFIRSDGFFMWVNLFCVMIFFSFDVFKISFFILPEKNNLKNSQAFLFLKAIIALLYSLSEDLRNLFYYKYYKHRAWSCVLRIHSRLFLVIWYWNSSQFYNIEPAVNLYIFLRLTILSPTFFSYLV